MALSLNVSAMPVESVSREELYGLVWSEPMTKVATRFDVSSSFLARVCSRLNVPRPPRGYWAKLAVGKTRPKPELPGPLPGDALEWTRGGPAPSRSRALPKPPEGNAPAATAAKIRRSPGGHPLVAGARQFFEGVKEAESGHLRPTKRRLVDLYVSKTTLERGLAFANRLFLALEKQGYRVTFAPSDQRFQRPAVDERISGGSRDEYGYGRWNPDRPTVVFIGTVAIGLTLFELSEEVELQYVEGKYVPVKQAPLSYRVSRNGWNTWRIKRHMASGKLCLRASSPYGLALWEQQWRETRKGELPSKIPAIVEELTAAAVTVAKLVEEGERRAEEQRREWQLQHERWEREERERRRIENTKESRKQLAEIVSAWGVARNVEAFFEDAERRAATLPDDSRQALIDLVSRARELLGGTDALQWLSEWRSPDER